MIKFSRFPYDVPSATHTMNTVRWTERSECRRNLSSKMRLCAPHYAKSQQQQEPLSSTRKNRAGSSRRAPKRSRAGRESHQLWLEINRRQMERSPAGIVATGDRFLIPRSAPRGQYDCFRQIQNDTRVRTWLSLSGHAQCEFPSCTENVEHVCCDNTRAI